MVVDLRDLMTARIWMKFHDGSAPEIGYSDAQRQRIMLFAIANANGVDFRVCQSASLAGDGSGWAKWEFGGSIEIEGHPSRADRRTIGGD